MLITVFAIIFVVIVSIIFVIIVFIIIVIILAFVIIVRIIRCGAPVEQCEKLWWLAPTTSFLEKANHLIIHFIFFKLI